MKSNSRIRFKVDFENIPIMEKEVSTPGEIDSLIENVKLKLFGRKR